jgi:hypothetical protein
MANEITASINIRCANGAFVFRRDVTKQIDQTGVGGGGPGTVSIGTTEEDIDLGDTATPGYAVLTNLDPGNYVTWGPKSGTDMVAAGRLNPGEPNVLRLDPGITIRMQANTAACLVQVEVLRA